MVTVISEPQWRQKAEAVQLAESTETGTISMSVSLAKLVLLLRVQTYRFGIILSAMVRQP